MRDPRGASRRPAPPAGSRGPASGGRDPGPGRRRSTPAGPGAYAFNHYGQDNGSTIAQDPADGSYAIDPDGAGPAEPFTLGDPDFNFKSLKVNLILRWEYRPGSTFFFVWTHNRTNYDDPGDFDVPRDARSLFDAHGENLFMIKGTYWFDI